MLTQKDINKLKIDSYKSDIDDLEELAKDIQTKLKIIKKIIKERKDGGEKDDENELKNESKNEQKVTQNESNFDQKVTQNESENAHFANGNESAFNPHSQLSPPWGS